MPTAASLEAQPTKGSPTMGRYRLLKRIGAGGMAEIFVATTERLEGIHKIVVVKRILPELASDAKFVQMFLDEARIAATLSHPNIVQTYDVGREGAQYYIAMEYLHGQDLAAVLRTCWRSKKQIPLDQALNIAIGITSGLHYAHEKKGFTGTPLNIVHRDATPSNVFITYDGSIKIVDFGIAKATNRANKTRTGTLKGKLAYMSPEQCRMQAIDRRTDVFAAGVMLYEMTTGRRLFTGDCDYEVLKKILEEPIPPPSGVRRGYPPELEAIVLKALAKNADERYESARALQVDLEAFALQQRIGISSLSLSRFMESVFGEHLEEWRAAEQAGADLVELIPGERTADVDVGSGISSGESLIIVIESEQTRDEASAPTPTCVGDLPVVRPRRRRKAWRSVALVAATLAALAIYPIMTAPWRHTSASPAPAAAAAGAAGAATAVTGAAPAATGAEVELTPPAPEPKAPRATPAPMTDPTASELAAAVDPVAAPAEPLAPDADSKSAAKKSRRHRAQPPSKPRAHGQGELRVMSSPSCELFVDGRSVGFTPVTGIQLPAKSHKLRLVNSRFGIDKTYRVSVAKGTVTKRNYRLESRGD